MGLVFAAELGRIAGKLPERVADRHRTILDGLGLPTTYPLDRWESLYASMQRDKKSRAGTLRFIVLDDLAKPRVLEGPEPSLLLAAYHEIGV